MSGRACPNVQLARRGLDFVHRFQTDVRLFRFLPAVPGPDAEHTSPRKFHERFARTVSEAIRLAATELLHLYPGEVRAIYRLYGSEGGRLEVVLYDGVPGGAGYCSRLGGPNFSLPDLLTLAKKRLDCAQACETGCRACLCDYGNQRYWDSFERQAAHEWLTSLLQPVSGAQWPGQYVRWQSPSLGGLVERLANHDEVHLVARTLVDSESPNDDCLNQLVSWMQAGKRLHVYLSTKLEDKPRSKSALTVYRRLHPYLVEGMLKFYALPQNAGLDWTDLPRIFTSVAEGGMTFRQSFALELLVQSLVAAPADIGVVDGPLQEVLKKLVFTSKPYDQNVLQEGSKQSIHELRPGDPRGLAEIFAPVTGAIVKTLTINDPYCGARANQKRLEAFIKTFRALVDTIDRFEIVCKESRDREGDIEHYLDVEMRIDNLLRDKGFLNRDVKVVPHKGSAKDFHGRQIDVVTVSADGCDELHRFFLTGGIDYLMDDSAATKVFHIPIML